MANEQNPNQDRIKPGLPQDQIVLGDKTPPATRHVPAPTSHPPKVEVKDNIREIVETVVFVVVLVLMLKTFLAEAFVIPTGSMADTLLGYHKQVTCDKCAYPFLVNYSSQIDPPPNFRPQNVIGCYCPNCRSFNQLPDH